MTERLTEEQTAFRDEVRAFFAEKLTLEFRRAGSLLTSVYADPDIARAWQRVLSEKGWAAPSWPVEYGGCDWTARQHSIFVREAASAGAPPLSPMGVNMVAHVIMRYGTQAQKDYFLPRTLNGDIFWCQGYSEPDAGSDLAALQMRADEDGDDFICNGSKTWSTHAHVADWMFALVRTSAESRRQAGVTFLLIDMRTPGVDIRPIVMLSGEHIQNQVFFTNVRVPKNNVVGEIGQGWSVAKHLLEFERGGAIAAPRLQALLARVTAAAQGALYGDGALAREPYFADKLAKAHIAVTAFEALELRMRSTTAAATTPSMMKTLYTEISQHITELALEAAGAYAAPFQPHAAAPGGPVPEYAPPSDGFVAGETWQAIAPLKYLNDRAASIYAGTNEIQRNIMARIILGA